MTSKRIGILCIIALAFLGSTSFCCASDVYPSKPIQLVCAFAPGGDSDLSGRIVADKLHQILGQPVVAVNKPGGSTALATNYVIGSKPDGYTLLNNSAPMVYLLIIMPQPPYRMEDIVPIGRIGLVNNLVLANKSLPVKNMAELIAYAKKHSRELSYSSAGVGTTGNFIGELINIETKIDLQHIPFMGAAPAMTALVGNHVQVSYNNLAMSLPHLKSGAVKALAVLSDKRDRELPQVPTAQEEGLPALMAPSYHIIYAPAKTPAPILNKLESALQRALEDADVRTKIEALSVNPSFLNSQETKNFLDNEIKKWTPVAKKANIIVK